MSTIDYLLRVLSGLLTPMIAVIAAYVAWRQFKTAHDKLRLDLFERRYSVYRGLMDLLAAITANGNVTQEDLGKFYQATDQKRFLFSSDIRQYLTTVRENAVQLRQLNRLIDPTVDTPDERRDPAIEEEAKLLSWFDKQTEEAQTRFEPYLGFYQRL